MVTKESNLNKSDGSIDRKPAVVIVNTPDGTRRLDAAHHIVSDQTVHVYLGSRKGGIDVTLPVSECYIARSDTGLDALGYSAGDGSGNEADARDGAHADAHDKSDEELVTDGGYDVVKDEQQYEGYHDHAHDQRRKMSKRPFEIVNAGDEDVVYVPGDGEIRRGGSLIFGPEEHPARFRVEMLEFGDGSRETVDELMFVECVETGTVMCIDGCSAVYKLPLECPICGASVDGNGGGA